MPIFTDAAVIEHTNVLPAGALVHGDFWFHFHTSHEDSFVIDPTLDPEALDFAFREPSALDEPELRDLVASLIPLPATIFTLAPALVGLIALTRKRV